MPTIKAFKGIHPLQEYINQIITNKKNLTGTYAQRKFENPRFSSILPISTLIEPTHPQTDQEEISIPSSYFEHFIDTGVFIQEANPVLYIYQISHQNRVQTGIWTITAIDDYLDNTIKKHELTRTDRQQKLVEYLQKTGMDANPVLITYRSIPIIESIISETTSKPATLCFSIADSTHKLWKITHKKDLEELISAFSHIPACYLADGHHRVAAASVLCMQKRKLNLKHTKTAAYNFFSTIYMTTDQLQIFEFNRLIKFSSPKSTQQLLEQIAVHFDIKQHPNITIFKPQKLHQFGMYLDKVWYKLQCKSHTFQHGNFTDTLDVNILQKYILEFILNISDAQTDPQLSFVSGQQPIELSTQQVDQGSYDIFFTLYPTSIEQLIKIADAQQLMPPKSTYFEPKFPAGLVIHQIG